VRFVRNRRELMPAISFSVALVVSVAAYLLHVWVETTTSSKSSTRRLGLHRAARPVGDSAHTQDMAGDLLPDDPYLMTIVPPLILLVLGVGGYALVGESRFSRAALAGYIVVTLAMWFTIGAHSSYWGRT